MRESELYTESCLRQPRCQCVLRKAALIPPLHFSGYKIPGLSHYSPEQIAEVDVAVEATAELRVGRETAHDALP